MTRRELARAATVIENGGAAPDDPRGGGGLLVGITGPPGAGKSTLVDALTAELRARGKTVAIVAVDPSSRATGGAILGDRIRMQRHYADEGVFIRSMATRGESGGLARSSVALAGLFRGAGFDVAILETVGVGQDEIEIAAHADVTVVVLVPGMGDDVQAIKAGIMEIAQVFVVNKADRPGVEQTEREIQAMLSLGEAEIPIFRTVAVDGTGVAALTDDLLERAELVEEAAVERRAWARVRDRLPETMQKYREKFGAEIGTDNAREIVSPEYAASVESRRRWTRATQKPAGALADLLFDAALRNPDEGKRRVVLMTAGGTGAGKTTALAHDLQYSDVQFLYDSNLNSKKSAVERIEAAKAAGNGVQIVFVHRDPVEALTAGVLPRAMSEGRVVDLEGHARMYREAGENFAYLTRKYSGDGQVSFGALDNSRRGESPRPMPVEKAVGIRYSTKELTPRLRVALEVEYAAGRISESVYRATLRFAAAPEVRSVPGTHGHTFSPGGIEGPSVPDLRRDSHANDGGQSGPEHSGEARAAEERQAGRLAGFAIDHIGIAVRSIDEVLQFYSAGLGLDVASRETVIHEKVNVAMLPVGNTRVELLEAVDADSTIARSIEKRGPGLHHVALRVPDLKAAIERLQRDGIRILGEPRAGAGGHVYVFVHPAGTGGVLWELIQDQGADIH